VGAVARRIQIQSIGLFILAVLIPFSASIAGVSNTLVRYSFDDNNVATGPDTFTVFRNSKGDVSLSTLYRFSGYRSVEIREVGGDGDFPELQGYFVLRKEGKLYAHFAILMTDLQEPLNLALAGPEGFRLAKDAIAFWLMTRDGVLYQYSDSMPKKLFPPRPFTWYIVDVSYDIDLGTYDLTIHEEGRKKAVVSIADQINASGQPGSSVDKFSFIGDLEDVSNVVYYVDDVVIGTDRSVTQFPFIAPGRRKLFIHRFSEYHKMLRQKRSCIRRWISPISA
jgi:hypothetical protein